MYKEGEITDALVIALDGRPASKKNSKQMFRNSRTGKMFTSPSKAFKRFHNSALEQIVSGNQKPADWDKVGTFDICYTFYRKGRLSQDVDNAMASVNDILQDAGIIDDDKNILSGSFCVLRGCPDWKTEVTITRLGGEIL